MQIHIQNIMIVFKKRKKIVEVNVMFLLYF